MILVTPVFTESQHSHPEQMGEGGPQVIECKLTEEEFEATRQIVQERWAAVSDFVHSTPTGNLKMRKIELAPPNVIIMDDLNYRKLLESQGLRPNEPAPGACLSILDRYIAIPRSLLNDPVDFSFKLTKELLVNALDTYEPVRKAGKLFYRLSNGIVESFEEKDDQSEELFESYTKTLRKHKSRKFPKLTNMYTLTDRADHEAIIYDENKIVKNSRPTLVLPPAEASLRAINEIALYLTGGQGAASQKDVQELFNIFLEIGPNSQAKAAFISLKWAQIMTTRDYRSSTNRDN